MPWSDRLAASLARRWASPGVRLAVLALVGAALASCREATAPRSGVAISLDQVAAPTYGTDDQGRPWLTCGVTLVATTVGSIQAQWEDATLYFFVANDRRTAVDSSVIPAATVQASWGGEIIGPKDRPRSGWTLTAGLPFAVTIVYRYWVVGAGESSSSVSFACTPPAHAGSAPRFGAVAIDSTSVLAPSGRVTVDFTVNSAVGLWATLVGLSGACDTTLVVGEPMMATDTRTATIALPPACSLGVPLKVTVTALDADLQSTAMATTLPGIVDTIAPTVEIMIAGRYAGSYSENLAGDWFVGDSIAVLFIAQDNGVVRALYWEVAPQGFRDSLTVNAPGGGSVRLQIPVPPGWAGPIQMRFYARDAAGNVSQAVESAPGAIYVVPTLVLPATTATVSLTYNDLAWDMRRNLLYLNQESWKKIGIFSRTSMSVTGAYQLNDYPVAFDLTPGGDSLVVAQAVTRSLAIIDLRGVSAPVTTVPLPGVDTTMQLAGLVVAANGKVLVTAYASATGVGRLYTYDLASGAVQLRADAGNGGQTGGGRLARSYDRSVVVLNGGPGLFQRYDAATDAFGPAKTARRTDLGADVDGDGHHVSVGGDLYDSTLEYVLTPSVGHLAYQPIVLSPDGRAIYFSYGNAGNVRSRTSDGSTIDHLQFPVTVNGLSMSPDGSTLAVTQETGGVDVLGFVTVPPLPGGAPVARATLPRGSSAPAARAALSPTRTSTRGSGATAATWRAAEARPGTSSGDPAAAVVRTLGGWTLRPVPARAPR